MNIRLPLQEEDIKKLKAGDMITLSGILYTARDQAHARLVQLIEEGRDLPIPLQDQVIYYTGPTPARPGAVIG
ncbi:MAG: fumarate hydratase C-terminal domain-containing protein, partial [Halanaerobiales bacterium]